MSHTDYRIDWSNVKPADIKEVLELTTEIVADRKFHRDTGVVEVPKLQTRLLVQKLQDLGAISAGPFIQGNEI